MKKRVVAASMVLLFCFCLVIVGWKSEPDTGTEKFNKKMFQVDKYALGGYCGVYLKQGQKYYTLNKSIGLMNSEKYEIGVGASEVYHWFGSRKVITVDDFEPVTARTKDKIVSYDGEIELYPAEFIQYTFLGYANTPISGIYYWDYEVQYERMAFPTNAFVVYDENNKATPYSEIEQGGKYSLCWDDLYGYHVVEMPPANCRLYERGLEKVEIAGTDMGDYLEYDLSTLEPGTYAVVMSRNRYGGLLKIETR